MLRLLSSDLVLDELDDFDLDDLPALMRLVHWAGLLGTRVLLSSATLPPALLEGMFQAYRAGRAHYRRNRGVPGTQEAEPDIACLWVDEFTTQVATCREARQFIEQHQQFVRARVTALDQQPVRRWGELLPLNITSQDSTTIHREFATQVREAMRTAHERHGETCPVSGKRISFGLVRMANIEPLFEVAQALFQAGADSDQRIHLCVYHSRFPLLIRSAIEAQLDRALNRRVPEAVYELPDIRRAIDEHPERNHLFVVLGSPVTEVGRDHDYDWAIVEPSSMRSLIQLAGRVQRHRQRVCEAPNILIFDTNLRHLESPLDHQGQKAAAFIKPGFESAGGKASDPFRLSCHRLGTLLKEDEYRTVTARPRIQPRPASDWQPKQSLVDLEHARLAAQMLPKLRDNPRPVARGVKPTEQRLDAACAWQFPQAALTWVLPQQQPFRANTAEEVELVFLPDDDEEELRLHRIHEAARRGTPAIYTTARGSLTLIDLDSQLGPRITPWGRHDLLALLNEQVEAQNLPLRICAEKFTAVSVYENVNGWRYHPALGFAKKK